MTARNYGEPKQKYLMRLAQQYISIVPMMMTAILFL